MPLFVNRTFIEVGVYGIFPMLVAMGEQGWHIGQGP